MQRQSINGEARYNIVSIIVSITRHDARPCPSQLACEVLAKTRSENQLVAFVPLLENFGLTMDLCEKLTIVQRKPDLAQRLSHTGLREQRAPQGLQAVVARGRNENRSWNEVADARFERNELIVLDQVD